MRSFRSANFSVLLGAVLLMGMSVQGLRRAYTLPWPPLAAFSAGPEALQDISLVVGGFRRLAADLAWVQMLQYMGTHRQPERDEDYDLLPKEEGAYGQLKTMALRISWLDPYFKEAYLYAAGILAWSPMIDRPEEAAALLQEGSRYSPDYWPFKTYLAAILYKKQDRTGEMTRILEESVHQPGCPEMVKSILANYYKTQKRYADAIRIWQLVLQTPADAIHYDTARRQINQMAAHLAHP